MGIFNKTYRNGADEVCCTGRGAPPAGRSPEPRAIPSAALPRADGGCRDMERGGTGPSRHSKRRRGPSGNFQLPINPPRLLARYRKSPIEYGFSIPLPWGGRPPPRLTAGGSPRRGAACAPVTGRRGRGCVAAPGKGREGREGRVQPGLATAAGLWTCRAAGRSLRRALLKNTTKEKQTGP